MSELHAHLCRYDSAAWRKAVETLAAEIHPIDRNATRIWLAFYPLDLFLSLESAEDPVAADRKLGLMGVWRLADQIDSSHRFFFAHRFWPQVKLAVQNFTDKPPDDLSALVTAVAEAAGRTARMDREFLLGITAAGL